MLQVLVVFSSRVRFNMVLFCRFTCPVLSVSLYTIVTCGFNPPRVRIGVRVTRDSCMRWSKTNQRKLLLSLPKKASVLPNWILRASLRKSLISSHMNTMKSMVGTSDLLSSVRFHFCVSQGRLDCLEVIIAHGADLTVLDAAGRRLKAIQPLGVVDY